MRKLLLFSSLGLICSMPCFAGMNIPGLSQSTLTEQEVDVTLAKTGLSENIDDITSDQDINKLELNEAQKHEALVWGLTEAEEKRYVLLMENQSKTFYEGLRLTPIDILGINARSEQERNHFAKLGASIEAQKVSKNIAWNNAFHKAYLEQVKGLSVVGDFDPSPYSPYAYKPVVLSTGDTLHFFVALDNRVSTIVISLLKALEETPGTTLHITLIDSDGEGAQLWANAHHLPKELVNQNRITLDIGRMAFDALALEKKKAPLLLLSKNNESRIVDLGRF